jgi:cytoskeletal protein RodZ
MVKWIIGIVVVVAAVGGLWWSGILSSILSPGTAKTADQATTTPQQQQQQQTPAPTNDLPTATTDTSNEALVQDTTAIDGQMQGLGSDSSSIDSSLNDKPVSQEF